MGVLVWVASRRASHQLPRLLNADLAPSCCQTAAQPGSPARSAHLQADGIHHGGQHSHIVGGGALQARPPVHAAEEAGWEQGGARAACARVSPQAAWLARSATLARLAQPPPALQPGAPASPGDSLAAAHHDGDLHALAGSRRHLGRDGLQDLRVDSKALRALQRLAADLEHHAAA